MYLRIFEDDNDFGFYDEGSKSNTDIKLTDEEYESFFDRQADGKQYKLKDKRPSDNSGGLFDYVEEYLPEPIKVEDPEPTFEERLQALEEALTLSLE